MITGPDGRLWIAGDRSATIVRVTTKGAVCQRLALPGVPAQAWGALGGLAVGNDRAVWLATPSSKRIVRISCPAEPPNAPGTWGVRATVPGQWVGRS